MVVDLFRWPPKARQFQEVIAAAVESLSREGRSYNYTRSACEQLRERILELRLPEKLEALVMVNNELTERECADICVPARTQLRFCLLGSPDRGHLVTRNKLGGLNRN